MIFQGIALKLKSEPAFQSGDNGDNLHRVHPEGQNWLISRNLIDTQPELDSNHLDEPFLDLVH